jgi:hypothetical protein
MTRLPDEDTWISDYGIRLQEKGGDLFVNARVPAAPADLDLFFFQLRHAIEIWRRQHPEPLKVKAPAPSRSGPKVITSGDPMALSIETRAGKLRFPITAAERAEVERLSAKGPGAIYGWVYGTDSSLAKTMEGATWKDFGVEDPTLGCRRLLAALEVHAKDLNLLRRKPER